MMAASLTANGKRLPAAPTGDSQGQDDSSTVNRFDGGVSRVAREQLPNGLDVLVAVRKGAPRVCIDIIYRVPQALDPPNAPGLSKLIARMLPRLETQHLSSMAKIRLMGAADTWFAQPKGWAGTDQLTLTLTVPREALEMALFIEADRMGFAAQAVTPAWVDWAHRQVQQDVADPGAEATDGFLSWATFGSGHPYSTAARSRQDVHHNAVLVAKHLQRYFQAGNASIVVAGDLEPSSVMDAARRTFGLLPGGSRVNWEPREMRPHAQLHVKAIGDYTSKSLMAWQTPAYLAKGDASFDVLALLLTQRMRKGSQKFCKHAWANQWSRELGSSFNIICDQADGYDSAQWRAHVNQLLREVGTETLAAGEVALARDQYFTQSRGGTEDPSWLTFLAFKQSSLKASPSFDDYFKTYTQTNATDLSGAVKRYLLRPSDAFVETRRPEWLAAKHIEGFTGITYRAPPPPKSIQAEDDPAWYRPPRLLPALAPKFPKTATEPLPGHATLRYVEQNGLPVIHAKLRLQWPNDDVDPLTTRVALQALLDDTDEGLNLSQRLWRQQGVTLLWYAGCNVLVFELVGTREHMVPAFRMIRDALAKPQPNVEGLEAAKQAALNSKDTPADYLEIQLARQVGSVTALRWNKVYLNPAATRVDAMTPSTLARFWKYVKARAEVHVSVVGPCSLPQARVIAAAAVSTDWKCRPPRPVSSKIPPPRIWVVDDATATTASINLIWPTHSKHEELGTDLMLEGLQVASNELGSVPAGAISPSTPFSMLSMTYIDANAIRVSLDGIELHRVTSALQELNGYFAALVERPDYAQLARMGSHYLQRGLLSQLDSKSALLRLVDLLAIDNTSVASRFDAFHNFGTVSRERLLVLAKSLTLERAIIVAKGPADRLKADLTAINHGEWTVIPGGQP